MFDVYNDIFNKRGKEYSLAMKHQPYAREGEFMEMFSGVNLSNISTILDVPSGGGYLKQMLNRTISVVEYDSAQSFSKENISLTSSKKFDLVYCLASLHHIVDKADFITWSMSLLHLGGYLCIGDVLKGSPESVFLDDFVGKHNGMGHEGLYLENNKPYIESVGAIGSKVLRNEYVACPWRFKSKKDMLYFFRTLFSLKNISDNCLFENIDKHLGIIVSTSEINVNFSLLYVTYHKS